MTGPASGRRTAPSSTRTANGGSRCRAARCRFSDARKSRRSLLASPATMIPRTPIARARVSVSASMREPTTRILPARPTSTEPLRSSPSTHDATWSCPRVGPPSVTIARNPRPVARTTMPMPGRTSLTMPAIGLSSGSVTSPYGDAPAVPPLEQQLTVRDAPAGRRVGRRRHHDVAHPRVANALDDRRAGNDRLPGGDERTIARREREAHLDRCLDQSSHADDTKVAPGGSRVLDGRPSPGPADPPRPRDRSARRSSLRPRPQRRLPRGEQVAPAIGPIGKAQRDVAQIDHAGRRARRRRRSRSAVHGHPAGHARGT